MVFKWFLVIFMQGPDFHIESPEPCFLTLAFFIAFFIIFVHNINFSKDLPARYYQKKKKERIQKMSGKRYQNLFEEENKQTTKLLSLAISESLKKSTIKTSWKTY